MINFLALSVLWCLMLFGIDGVVEFWISLICTLSNKGTFSETVEIIISVLCAFNFYWYDSLGRMNFNIKWSFRFAALVFVFNDLIKNRVWVNECFYRTFTIKHFSGKAFKSYKNVFLFWATKKRLYHYLYFF